MHRVTSKCHSQLEALASRASRARSEQSLSVQFRP
jgi:hypothetical protein